MKKFLAIVLVLATVLCLCACGNTGDAQNESTQKTTTAPVEETTQPVDDGKVTYTVKVVDEQGNGVAGVMVQLCLDSCIPAVTDATGVATWKVAEAAYQASFVSVPAGYAQDANKYDFASGTYELTLTLKAA